jgi:hypothetical protein
MEDRRVGIDDLPSTRYVDLFSPGAIAPLLIRCKLNNIFQVNHTLLEYPPYLLTYRRRRKSTLSSISIPSSLIRDMQAPQTTMA